MFEPDFPTTEHSLFVSALLELRLFIINMLRKQNVHKACSPDYEAFVVFNQEEFAAFLKKMVEFKPLVRDVEFEVFLCELQKYRTFICKKKVIKFQPKFKNVYQHMYISVAHCRQF
ncbi:hypothetical protein Zmor_012445 [Zophobas morio]|uniref:Uncharacterized protein n=1 Tax=Zophobas morio TaxID=2755281 RepID=A0AA38MED4_9CUCU|nr:hypothetical protein Zmor_012445 [Zophobas morio]